MIFGYLRYTAFAALCTAIPTHTLIYKIALWQHPESGQGVYIVHYMNGEYVGGSSRTELQRADLINAAHNVQAHMIYTDICQYTGSEPGVLNLIATVKANALQPSGAALALLDELPSKDFDYTTITSWQQNNNVTLSADLHQFLQHAQLSHVNAECRHLIFASSLGHPVTFAQVQQETNALIASIEKYDDGAAYNRFYREKIEHFQQTNTDILDDQEAVIPLDFQYSLAHSAQAFPFIRLMQYAQELTDAKIAHELALAQEHNNIFLVFPGDYADAISAVMPRLGYQEIQCIGCTYWRDIMQGKIAYHPLDITAAFATFNGHEYIPSVPVTPMTWYGRLWQGYKQQPVMRTLAHYWVALTRYFAGA